MTHPSRLARTIDTSVVRRVQLGIVLGLGAVVAAAYLSSAEIQAETARALAVLGSGDGHAVGDYLLSFGVWAPIASLFLMVLQAVAAPIPAIFVAFANGLAFGVVGGGLLTVAGQTLAAALCFGISRALGRGPAEALAGRFGLVAADTWFSRWGARGVLLLRLVPGVSFDVISYGAGLTSIRFGPFLLATAIGVAPQAFLYAYLIREAPQSAWVFYAVSWLVIGAIGSVAFLRRKPSPAIPAPDHDAQPGAAPSAGECKAA
ncbi:MAG: TVP38/TMEM64 family protein [Chloroflexota bacterium]|nr:TVP38/TMEM64 family protein [Chloroflexota bacterium]